MASILVGGSALPLPSHALDANALPSGGQVVAGAATIAQSGNRMDIGQSTDRAILNWSSFNIGANAQVNFMQPGASSVVLNRVSTSAGASDIQGQLTANGQVFLINPNGVLFGKGAQVNVGGLVASTLDIRNEDFLAGRYTFNNGGSAGSVVNRGALNAAEGGYIALLAPEVRNEGVIAARLGSVALAAGDRVALDFAGDSLINLAVSKPALNALVENRHLIQADGGTVILAARSAGDLASTVVNTDGLIQATSVSVHNGVIRLEGGERGIVAVSGTLDATGSQAGATGGSGGTIKVLGNKVGLFDGARIDVSGEAGGGTVLVGGNFQGKGPEPNARFTYVAPGAQIYADSLSKGNGGKVVVWADDTTRYFGGINARGGLLSGNGGFVEVSGRKNLDFHGRIDVASPNGTGGRVLLDPQDIVLNATVQASPPNNANGTPDIAFADPPDPGTTTIQVGDVTGYSEIYLQATRDITINSALTMAAGNSMRFEANNNITVGAALATTTTGIINLKADADASGAGTLTLNAALTSDVGGIVLSGASVSGNAAGTINSTGAANGAGGNVSITATNGTINLAGAITTTGGAAGANSPGRNAGNVTLNGVGVTTVGITASGSNGSGAASIQPGGAGGTVQITSTGGVTTTTVTASGGAGGVTVGAAGGNAGSITISNSTAGNISTGALTARTGSATGAGAGGTVAAPAISVTNTVAAGSIGTGAIDTRGGSNGVGGNALFVASGDITLGGTVQTTGGALVAGNAIAGKNAGNVTIKGVNRSVTGAITATGGAAVVAGNAGGNAGTVLITGTDGTSGTAGTLSLTGITDSTGGSSGTVASGTPGSITLDATTVTATGNLTTTGGANGAGGAITATATTGQLNITGTITASGGTANASSAGSNAGNVTLSGVNVTTTSITASGSGATTAGSNQPGGAGGAVQITSTGGVTTTTVTASGGAAQTTNANGGNAGSIAISNSTAGNISTGALTARTGNAQGTGAGGTVAGTAISISNTAAGASIGTGAIDTRGGTKGAGGNLLFVASGDITLGGTVQTTGGALTAGTVTAGTNAGNVTIKGVNRSVTGLITTSGGAAIVAGNAGGAGGALLITGTDGTTATSGTLSLTGATTTSGAAVGAVASGTSGSITLGATTVTATGALTTTGGSNGAGGAVSATTTSGALNITGAITTTGGTALVGIAGPNAGNVTLSGDSVTTLGITANGAAGIGNDFAGGNGGNVSVTATANAVSIGGAISTIGGNGVAGNANGGNSGTITLDAGATTPSITLANNLTTTGGNRVGTGTAGSGGQVSLQDPVLLNVATVTVAGGGGSGALGTGGDVQFAGTVDSTGGARALVVNTNGTTTFGGVVGGSSALSTLTTNAGGTTAINGGAVTTSGTQTYNDAVTLGATTELSSTGGTITLASTLAAGANPLTLTADTLTFSGGAGSIGGSSTLALRPTADNVSVGVGGAAGTLQVTTTNVSALADGFSGITLGRSGGTALTTLNAATFTDPVTIQQGGVGGTIAVNGLLTGTGNASVALNAPGGITFNNAGVTTANQNIGVTGPATLSGGAIVFNAGGGDVSFSSTINGAQALTVNSTGTTTFSGAIGGATALTSLTTNAGGTTAIDGGTVTTSGTQTYNDAVTLGATTELSSTGGTIMLTSTLAAGANPLTLTADTLTFSGGAGSIGGSSTLALRPTADNVSVGVGGAAGTLQVTTANVSALADGFSGITLGRSGGTALTTLNAATFTDPVTIQQGGVGGTIAVNGLLTGTDNASVALNAPGGITFNNAGVTTANQNIGVTGPVTLSGGAIVFNAGGGDVSFSSTINGAQALTVNSTGTTTFSGAIGGATALTSFTTNTGGTTAINGGAVTTTGNQTYNDAVTLGATTTLNAGVGNVSFGSTINGAQALTVNSTGTTTFSGAVGGTTALTSLTTNAGGTTAIDGGAVTTTGDQTYGDAVTTGGAASLTASAGTISASGVVTATAGTLSLSVDATKDVSLTNAANNFGTVSVSSGKNISLVDTNALTLGTSSVSGNFQAVAGGALTLSGTLTTAAAAGTSITLSGQSFTNTAGAGALSPGAGSRFLVWSANPSPFSGGTPDNRGGVAYDFKQYNATYGVTAVAQAAGNGFLYTYAPSITPTLTGTVSKVYDSTNTATLAAGNYSNNAVDSDTVVLNNPAAGTYDDANAGTNKNVSVAGIAINSASNGAATVYGYQLASATANANIGVITAAPVGGGAGFTPISLNGGMTAANKVYDGTTAATITSRTLSGVVGADDVHLVGGTASFDNKNVGTGKTVTASGFSLNGTASGNYYLYNPVITTTASITPAPLNLAATVANKVYDGTTAATVTGYGLSGFVGNETVSAVSTGANFADKNAGTGKLVTITGISLTDGTNGGLASNYSVPSTTTAVANITAANLGIVLTAGITAANKIYDGTTAAIITGRTLLGVKGSDDVQLVGGTATFDNKNAGTGKIVTAVDLRLSGAASGNYTANTTATTTADILPAPLSLAATVANKVYDGTTVATVTGYGLSGFVGSETVSAVSTGANFADRNVGTGKAVFITGLGLRDGANGGLASNYSIPATIMAAADILPAKLGIVLTAGITAASKVYDGTTAATITGRTLLGVQDNDDVKLVGGTATFDNKNVGTGKTVTAVDLRLSGAAAGNYTANTTATTTADITPAPLTLAATVANKVYDGATTATVTDYGLAGFVGNETLSAVSTGVNFADRNAGTGKLVTIAGISLKDGANGGLASNYSVPSKTTAIADIDRASLTVSGLVVRDKVYDATTEATLAGTGVLSGVVGGDRVALDSSSIAAAFVDKNAGVAKPVTLSGIRIEGADAGNYTISSSVTERANIAPAPLGVRADDKSMQAGAALPSFSASFSGFVPGEDAAHLGGALAFNTTATTASPAGSYRIEPSGLTATNYRIDYIDGKLTIAAPTTFINDIVATLPDGQVIAKPQVAKTTVSKTEPDRLAVDATVGGKITANKGKNNQAPDWENVRGLVLMNVSPTIQIGGCGVNMPGAAGPCSMAQ